MIAGVSWGPKGYETVHEDFEDSFPAINGEYQDMARRKAYVCRNSAWNVATEAAPLPRTWVASVDACL